MQLRPDKTEPPSPPLATDRRGRASSQHCDIRTSGASLVTRYEPKFVAILLPRPACRGKVGVIPWHVLALLSATPPRSLAKTDFPNHPQREVRSIPDFRLGNRSRQPISVVRPIFFARNEATAHFDRLNACSHRPERSGWSRFVTIVPLAAALGTRARA